MEQAGVSGWSSGISARGRIKQQVLGQAFFHWSGMEAKRCSLAEFTIAEVQSGLGCSSKETLR